MTSDGWIPLSTLEDSEQLAHQVLELCPQGALLLLAGPLGAGKTTFTRLLGQLLGSSAAVTSPTYTLVHEYPTPHGLLVHIDAYRLPDAAALPGLGLDDYLERARLVVVEWGLPLKQHYPNALVVEFSLQADDHSQVHRCARVVAPEQA